MQQKLKKTGRMQYWQDPPALELKTASTTNANEDLHN
jgi:hypothetical protein